MLFRQLKTFSMCIVLLLAILQAVLPLLHAHPAGNSIPDLATGIHIGGIHMQDVTSHPATPALEANHDHLQAIGVGNANEPERLQLPQLMLVATFLLITLLFGGAVRNVLWRVHDCQPVSASKFFIAPLRAPPHD